MKFRPSSAHRWATGGCTGSPRAEADAYKMPESEQAAEGNRLHALAADVLNDKRDITSLDPDDRRIVEPYVVDVWSRHAALDGGALLVERRVPGLAFPDPGTPDALFGAPAEKRLVISDLKTGYRPVSAEENIQLIMYAIECGPPEDYTVELRIIQPNVSSTPDVWELPASGLQLYYDMILARIDAARTDPKLVSTPSNCTYCKAASSCKALQAATLGGHDMALRETGRLPASEMRTELIRAENILKLVTVRHDALRAETEARLNSGEQVDGCAMVQGKSGALAWTGQAARIEEMCGLAGVDPMKHKLITPKQAIAAGVPGEIVEALAERKPAKMKLDTEAIERMFPDE